MSERQLLAIEAFMTVVETGGFTRAALQLGTSKSVISRRIAQLEDSSGIELLRRSTRRVHLTEEGQWFAKRLESILPLIDEAETELRQRRNVAQGLLRIVLPSYLGSSVLTEKIIPDYLTQNPKVNVDVRLSAKGPLDLPEAYDVALMTRIPDRPMPSTSARLIPFGRVTAGVFATPMYLKRFGTPKTPEDLIQHRCLSHRSPVWRFDDGHGNSSLVNVRPVLTSGSNEAPKSAVLSGLGVLYSMRSTFSNLVTSGALIEILKPFTAASGLDLVALVPESRQIPLRVENFIQMLRAYRWQSTDFGLGPSNRVLG